MIFDKTDLIEGTLVIQNEDGTTTFIPQERCEFDPKAKELFDEFTAFFPKGKENYKIVDGQAVELTDEEKAQLHPTPIPVPTTEEKLVDTQKELESTQKQLLEAKTQLDNVASDFTNFMTYIFENVPNL